MIETLSGIAGGWGRELSAQPSTPSLCSLRQQVLAKRMNGKEPDMGMKEHPSFAPQKSAMALEPKPVSHTSLALLELINSQPVLPRRQTSC